MEAGGKGLRVKTSEGAGGKKAVEEKATGVVLEVLEDTSVGRWLPASVARASRGEEVGKGEVSEGGEEGPPPPRGF